MSTRLLRTCAVLLSASGTFALASTLTLQPTPTSDANVEVSYDFHQPITEGLASSVSLDIGQNLPGVSILMTPAPGRSNPPDTWRPFSGIIYDQRDASEISLAPLSGSTLNSASISFDVGNYFGNPVTVLVEGYAGQCTNPASCTITYDDYGVPDLLNPANPANVPAVLPTTLIGTLNVNATGSYSLDATSWLQTLYAAGTPYAGILLAIDQPALPSNTTIVGDTSYGFTTYSADSGDPVTITADVTAAPLIPEPSSLVLLGTGMGLLGAVVFFRKTAA